MIFKDADEMQMVYRAVFDSPHGRKVLADMAEELQFVSNTTKDVESMVLENFFKLILQKCGVWREDGAQDLVNAFFAMPMRK